MNSEYCNLQDEQAQTFAELQIENQWLKLTRTKNENASIELFKNRILWDSISLHNPIVTQMVFYCN